MSSDALCQSFLLDTEKTEKTCSHPGITIWHLALCIRCHLALETHAFRALDSFIRFDYEWAGLLHFQSFSFSLAHRKARDELC